METETPVRTGALLVPPQGFLKKSWSKKFYALYRSSNHGIQRLEVFESEDHYLKQSPYKIIPLTDCIKVTHAPQKQQSNVFEVRTKSHSYLFSAESFHLLTEWISSLQNVAFGTPQKTVPSLVVRCPNPVESVDVQQEDNMLYSSMDKPEVYPATALETEAGSRCGLNGDYRIVVTSVSLSLAEESQHSQVGRVLFTWPYRHIRRYGCFKNIFSFEAGRKCSSGEGLFSFETKDGNIIFQSVATHVSALKTSHNDFDLQSSPSPGPDKASATFFGRHSTLGIEGFRASPIFLHDVDLKSSSESIGCETGRKSTALTTSVVLDKPLEANDRCLSLEEDKKSVYAKPKPPIAKPPRKSKLRLEGNVTPPTADNIAQREMVRPENKVSSMEVVDHVYEDPVTFEDQGCNSKEVLYSEPEERKEAWKTLGRDVRDESHSPDEPLYAVLETNAANTDSRIPVAKLTNKLKQMLNFNRSQAPSPVPMANGGGPGPSPACDGDSCDRLLPKGGQPSRFASLNPNSHHVYGKLQPNRVPVLPVPTVTDTVVSTGGSLYSNSNLKYQPSEMDIKTNNNVGTYSSNPLESRANSEGSTGEYMNVMVGRPSGALEILDISQELASSTGAPHHFTQNDVEYAKIMKRGSKC